MGKHWEQPPIEDILVDDTHTVMTRSTFLQLKNYSRTNPTGAYQGKMWRREEPDLREGSIKPTLWLLCWFGPDPRNEPGYVGNYYREILLID